jgi:hypothetical protein
VGLGVASDNAFEEGRALEASTQPVARWRGYGWECLKNERGWEVAGRLAGRCWVSHAWR